MARGHQAPSSGVDTDEHRPTTADYSLGGPRTASAIAGGLADGTWFRPPVDAERLRALMERDDRRAARDVALWVGLLAGCAVMAFVSLGTWYAVPAFAVFGALYGGSADPRWHEHGHATAFRARWANDVVYHLAAFMLLREPTLWRWSHFRHHSDTIIVGRDPEISFPRPTRLRVLLPNYLNLISGPKMIWLIAQHAVGRLDPTTRELVPKTDRSRVVFEARVYIVVLGGVLAWAVSTGTIVPLLFVGLPSFYGAWLIWFFAITQHAGLREDVLDHRLNTRTVRMNPCFRFLYLNMNYHLEHHLFPAVPYYHLPELHEEIKAYLPPPKSSMWAAYREIVHALRMQRRDPSFELPLPFLRPSEGEIEPAQNAEVASAVSASGAATSERLDEAVHEVGGRGGDGVDLGPAAGYVIGRPVRIERDGAAYLLCRLAADAFALTDGLCTHAKAELAEGHLDGCVIECPKHNGRFDVRTGAAVRRPAIAPLRTYVVEVVAGRVVAHLEPARASLGLPDGEEESAADTRQGTDRSLAGG